MNSTGSVIMLSATFIVSLYLALVLTLVELPDVVAFARPALVPMVAFYWALRLPRHFGLLGGWVLGLILDVVMGTPLGQHALALAIGCYVLLKLSDLLEDYPAWQQTFALIPVFTVYEFILFWADGLIGHSVEPLWRWAPVLTSVLLWPFVAMALSALAPQPRHS